MNTRDLIIALRAEERRSRTQWSNDESATVEDWDAVSNYCDGIAFARRLLGDEGEWWGESGRYGRRQRETFDGWTTPPPAPPAPEQVAFTAQPAWPYV